MEYLTVKWLHILSSPVLFGTGIGSAYYLLAATLERDPCAPCRNAVRQPLAYVVACAVPRCAGVLLPVLWLQVRMCNLAQVAAANARELPPLYWRYFRLWFALGVPAFFALVAVFYLMVAKPA